jgi:hypothetical protein
MMIGAFDQAFDIDQRSCTEREGEAKKGKWTRANQSRIRARSSVAAVRYTFFKLLMLSNPIRFAFIIEKCHKTSSCHY